MSQETSVEIRVGKGAQQALTISGIPDTITCGDAPFTLSSSGGSGSGAFSYAVTSGSAVSVDSNGTVTILGPGTAVLTVTKAADDYYNSITKTVEIAVEEAEESSPAASSSAAAPDASPSPAASAGYTPLKPLSIQADESTGRITIRISIDDLPEGTAFIQLPSGDIMNIQADTSTLSLQASQDDLNEDGTLVIIALDEEKTPLGNYQVDLADEVWQEDSSALFSTIVWIAAGILVLAAVTAAAIWMVRKKRRG
jgi:hypothetical protein